MLSLLINGERLEVAESIKSINDLLSHLQLQEKIVIVEHNECILEKSSYGEVTLTNDDVIEIVHFVGGG